MYGVSVPGNIQNSPGQSPEQPALDDLSEGGGWTRSFPEAPASFSDSIVHFWLYNVTYM